MGTDDERRAVDHAKESRIISAEAAELAEHIRDTEPRHKRKELFDQLVHMIDDAHQAAAEAEIELE